MIPPEVVGEILRWILVAEAGIVVLFVAQGRTPFSLLLIPIALAGHLQPRDWGLAELTPAVGYAASVVWRLYDLSANLWMTIRARIQRGPRIRIGSRHRGALLVLGGLCLGWLIGSVPAAILVAVFLVLTYRFRWFAPSVLPRHPLRDLILRSAALVTLLVVSGVALLVTYGGWSWIEPQGLAKVLPQLIAIQLVLGLLPLTALLVVAQVATSAYGPRTYRVLPYLWVLGAVAVVLASICFDLWWLGQPQERGAELAELLAFGAVAIAVLVGVVIFRYLDWEMVVGRFLLRLDDEWLGRVFAHFENPYAPQGREASNPTSDIERLLYLAATRDSDIRRFRLTLEMTKRQIDLVRAERNRRDDLRLKELRGESDGEQAMRERVTYVRDRVEPALDEHLADAFSALIADVARERKPWALKLLVDFRRALAPTDWKERSVGSRPGLAPVAIERERPGDGPTGCRMYIEIVDAAIANQIDDAAVDGIHAVSAHMDRALERLPEAKGVTDVDPNAQNFQADLPGEKLKDAIEEYFKTLSQLGRDASKGRRREPLSTLAWIVSREQEAYARVSDPNWAYWLTASAGWCAYEIASAARDQGLLAYRVPRPWRGFDATNQVHRRWLDREAFLVPLTLIAIAPVVEWLLVGDAAGFARDLVGDFPTEAAGIAAALRVLDERLAKLEPTPERRQVHRTIEQRLEQIRQKAGGQREKFDSDVELLAAKWRAEVPEP